MIPCVHPPAKFFSKGFDETFVLQLYQIDGEIAFADGELVVGIDGLESGIEGAEETLGASFHLERQDRGVRNHNRAHIQVVRRDGSNDKIAGVGENDRSAATQRVSRGACWR